jgi:iron complex outermembrane receptor protein
MLTYRGELTHQFTDDIMAYVSYNRGVKSGQFDTFGTAETGPIISPPVAPEILKAWELGVKSEYFDDRLRLNADAFHYDITNLQFAIIVPGGTKLINAAGATENGGEFDATLIPITNLTLDASMAVMYGHYTSFLHAPDYFIGQPGQSNCPINTDPNFPNSCNAKGFSMVRTPHYTAHFAADYDIPSSVGDFDLNVNYTFTDTWQWFPDGSLEQPATNIVNASVTWTNPTGMFDVRLWADNVGSDKYYSFGSESIGLGKQFSPAPPRTIGITLGAHI